MDVKYIGSESKKNFALFYTCNGYINMSISTQRRAMRFAAMDFVNRNS